MFLCLTGSGEGAGEQDWVSLIAACRDGEGGDTLRPQDSNQLQHCPQSRRWEFRGVLERKQCERLCKDVTSINKGFGTWVGAKEEAWRMRR